MVVVVVAVADSDIPSALRNEATLPDIYVFLPIVAGISSDRCF